jgi:hypothetical protein
MPHHERSFVSSRTRDTFPRFRDVKISVLRLQCKHTVRQAVACLGRFAVLQLQGNSRVYNLNLLCM